MVYKPTRSLKVLFKIANSEHSPGPIRSNPFDLSALRRFALRPRPAACRCAARVSAVPLWWKGHAIPRNDVRGISMSQFASHHPTSGDVSSPTNICFGDVKQIPQLSGHQSQALYVVTTNFPRPFPRMSGKNILWKKIFTTNCCNNGFTLPKSVVMFLCEIFFFCDVVRYTIQMCHFHI